MKLFKTAILAVAAITALGFTACSDDDYTAAAAPDGVFFPNDLATSYEVPNTSTSFDITVKRIGATDARDYALTATYDSDIFTVPSVVSFPAGSSETTVTIVYDPAVMAENFAFDLRLELSEADASSAGNRVLEASVMMTAPWSDWVDFGDEDHEPYGTFNYALNWYFGGQQSSIKVLQRYNTEHPEQKQLRLTNWGEDEVANGLNMIVNGSDVQIPLQDTGVDIQFTNGTFRLGVMDWNTYRALNGVAPDPSANGVYTPDKGLFNLYMVYAVNVDGTWYAQSSGWESFQMNDYPDYTLTVEYQGLTTNADVTETNGIFMANVASGLANARFAISRTMDVDALVEAVKNNTVNFEMLNAGEEQEFNLPLEGKGSYNLVGVGYNADEEAVVTVSSTFTIGEGVSEWKTAGNATFLDGWITAAFRFGQGEDARDYTDFPWEVGVLESVQEAGVYALRAPYCSTDWVMNNSANSQYGIFTPVNITVDCSNPDCVVIPPQYSGYTMKAGSLESVTEDQAYYIANRAGLLIEQGMTKEQIIAQGANDRLVDGVVEIHQPQVCYNNDGEWGAYQSEPVAKITFDFLTPEGASLMPRHKASGLSRFETVTGINSLGSRKHHRVYVLKMTHSF